MILINTKHIKTIVFSEELKLSIYKYRCTYKKKYIFFGPKIYYECWEVEHCQFTREDILENPSLRIVGDSVYRRAYLEIDKVKYYFTLNQEAKKVLDKILTVNPYIAVIQ